MDALTQCQLFAKQHFGIEALRPEQHFVLNTLLSSEGGILATLPTGLGKTLLYALPALIFAPNPVLVICPLISLMRDQVRRMDAANISSTLFTSDQSSDERKQAYQKIANNQVRLIFASPERLMMPSFVQVLQNCKISMAVVDEAHCVVHWGPSFRPEYGEISKVLLKLAPSRILAITATASKVGRKIIAEKVFPQGYNVNEIVFPPLRKNIFVESTRTATEAEKWLNLVATLKQTKANKTIIYFPRRDLCDKSVLELRKLGFHAVTYHAGLSKDDRRTLENYVHATEKKIVICATQAYGMGVDIAGVELIIVFGFPSGIEDFLQMIGRAGRKGEQAHAKLLWTGADPKKREFQFLKTYPTKEQLTSALNDLLMLFPTQYSKRLGTALDIENSLKVTKNKAEMAQGVLTALRIMGAVEVPMAREFYLQIKFNKAASVTSLLQALPSPFTRRGQLLKALATLTPEPLANKVGAETLLAIGIVCDAANMSWSHCEEVLNHFAVQQNLQWQVINTDQMSNAFFWTTSFAEAKAKLSYYVTLQRAFYDSLYQLEQLARNERCRLAQVFKFFDGNTNKTNVFTPCGQCDLCKNNTAPLKITTNSLSYVNV